MQPEFVASRDPDTIENVKKLVVKANETSSPIIVVEYKARSGFFGDPKVYKTEASIMRLVEENPNYIIVTKNRDDGSQYIINGAQNDNIDLTNCVVCGVNTGCCVSDTVTGLSDMLPNSSIEIVASACNHYSSFDNEDGRLVTQREVSLLSQNLRNVVAA